MRIGTQVRRLEHSKERGVTMVLVAIAMVAIIAMAAMSIDLVTLYLAREESQRTADAAALASARVLSVAGPTSTGDPGATYWPPICGGTNSWSTQAAAAVAAQNSVNGRPSTVTVMYSDGSVSNADCSTLGPAFGVNPMVTVQISPASIPSFFSRIWGSTSSSVSATATAEAFNPSGSDRTGVATNGVVTPVQPRCVKPWIVPNREPLGGTCSPGPPTNTCPNIVSLTDGRIRNAGVSTDGSGDNGIVGEQFFLVADCVTGSSPCAITPIGSADNPPVANSTVFGTGLGGRLDYLPGAVIGPAAAVPSCASSGTAYESAVAGCDQTTVYQCGLQVPLSGNPNQIDLSENPGGAAGDTAMGLACLLTNSTTLPLDGQDQLRSTSYPFVAFAGDANPLRISGPIANSNSIMTLPIYDDTAGGGTINTTGTTNVTIVGFLQVFVNDVDPNGNVQVTVMNVAGCGSNAFTNAPVNSNSPIPIRLITPP